MTQKKITIPVLKKSPQKDCPWPEKMMNSLQGEIENINEQFSTEYPLGVSVERNNCGFIITTDSIILGSYFTIDIEKECITSTRWLFSGGDEIFQHAKSHAEKIAELIKNKTNKDFKVVGF